MSNLPERERLARIHQTKELIKELVDSLTPAQRAEVVRELAGEEKPDFLSQALNEGDGVYRS